MSILIKGIDLPKEKDEALMLLILGDGTVAEKIGTNRYEEILDTQAIQIDRPHGRLIDADKVFTYDKIAEDQLKEVPTILEEEE